MSLESAQAGQGTGAMPSPGQVIGGRFQVERTVREDSLGMVLAARDTKTKRAIALRVLTCIKTPDAAKVLKAECRTVAQLSHRSIVATYGVGSVGGNAQFVACEWVDGAPLSQLVQRRKERGGRLSLRGAYNVVAHVCKALGAAHGKTSHGALRPSVVWVTKSGRVKVGEFGVGRAVVTTAGAVALGDAEQACLAPEVKAGSPPDARSDIFGVGALLYEMLTQKSPAEGFVPPSQAHPDATPEIDQVLLKCLAGDPAARYETPDQVQKALLPLVAEAPKVSAEEDFGIDIDIDVDLASVRPAAPAAPVPPPRGSSPDAPRVGSRVSIDQEFRPSLSEPPRQSLVEAVAPEGADVHSTSGPDLKDLLAKITENDAPRWMVVKDKLDHGPFSGRELVNMILKGEVVADHGLLNMDTGERNKVKGFSDFTEFLEQYRLKTEKQQAAAALQRSATVEKASNALKFVIGGSVLAVVAVIGLVFLLTREEASEDEGANLDARADLFERGDIEITGTAGILPPPQRGRRGRRGGMRGGGMGGGGMGGSLTYEEAMERAVSLGDATMGGGEQQLSSSTVAGVMNRHINSMFGCVSQELRRGGSLGQVQIDLAIQGSGQVQGASVRQGSGAFKSCIAGRVRRIRFPSFSAPRMGARYSFSVD